MQTLWFLRNKILFACLCSSFLFVTHFSEAVDLKNDKANDSTKTKNLSFEDLLVSGKYHFSDEAVATVEQDKVLDGLLGIRKDFKDRLAQSANQR